MKYTKENSNIMHEIGHLIMYILWMSRKKNFNREYFTNQILEISIIEKGDSLGRVTINKKALVDKFCAKLVYLGGVLFSLEYVDHPEMLWRFDDKKQIEKNFIDVYCKFGGYEDLLWVINNIHGVDFNYIATYIHEFKKIIKIIKKDKAIKRIIHKLYKNLQKDKCISGDKCYSIISPHILDLKTLGQQIYNPFTRFKINAKTLLF